MGKKEREVSPSHHSIRNALSKLVVEVVIIYYQSEQNVGAKVIYMAHRQ